jgi:hypothetical protein
MVLSCRTSVSQFYLTTPTQHVRVNECSILQFSFSYFFYSFVFILFCIKENHPRFMNIPYVKIKIIFEHLHFFKQIFILFYELICHRNDVFDIKIIYTSYSSTFSSSSVSWFSWKTKKINYLFLFNPFENCINVLLFELQKLTSL